MQLADCDRSFLRCAFVVAISFFSLFAFENVSTADESLNVGNELQRTLIEPALPLREVQAYVESRMIPMPEVTSASDWERHAKRMRTETLDKVVFRGEAAKWRDAKVKVEWKETLDGGPGYKIKKLLYEALPGLWIPAVLYEPQNLNGKVPVGMAVNGHDPIGKATKYKQIRCINMAKRGMVVLNPEWLNMGQLRGENYAHYRMNQIDLCGTSGLAPFYLAMSKGLDVLLAHPNADATKVAVSGLSGGGWQTIFISSLDTRVTLANPVAGYSSIGTRARYSQDLGDSEQTPSDLVTTADYSQMTALLAPRATLLTYNAKDNCCFKAEHALPPLVEAARPVFALYGKTGNLRTHVNHDPGDHNFELENREAYYKIVGDHFFAGQPFDSKEIPSAEEVKTPEQLNVELPKTNEDFHSLAMKLAEKLPHAAAIPTAADQLTKWSEAKRNQLREITRFKKETIQSIPESASRTLDHATVTHWWLRHAGAWTIPAVEFTPEKVTGSVLIVTDEGRKSIPAGMIEDQLKQGNRVVAMDPFYLGESKISERDFLHALQLACVGDRPLGLQASQIASVAAWIRKQSEGLSKTVPVRVISMGPRTSLATLVASALEPDSISEIELHKSLRSLKQVIEKNMGVNEIPEYFCFGLLEFFDIPQLTALTTPRRSTFVGATE